MLFLQGDRTSKERGVSAKFKQAGGGPRGHDPHRPIPGQSVKDSAIGVPGIVVDETTNVSSLHGGVTSESPGATPQHGDVGTSTEEIIEETPVKNPLEDLGTTSPVPPVKYVVC